MHQVVPDITLPTSEALIRAMAKNPSERFQSYDELIMALTASRSQLLIEHFRNQARDDGKSRGWWRR